AKTMATNCHDLCETRMVVKKSHSRRLLHPFTPESLPTCCKLSGVAPPQHVVSLLREAPLVPSGVWERAHALPLLVLSFFLRCSFGGASVASEGRPKHHRSGSAPEGQ